MDVSADGDDIFFTTPAALVSQDRDGGAVDLYDARVGGGFPDVPPSPGACEGSACQGPGQPPPGDERVGSSGGVESRAGLKARKCGNLRRKAKDSSRAAKRVSKQRTEKLQRRSRGINRKVKKCRSRSVQRPGGRRVGGGA